MRVLHRYIPMHKKHVNRRGLSERQLRKRLERKEWIVWRGGSIHITRQNEVYPNVRAKYELLNKLLEQYHPGILEYLQYLCSVHYGMPDFICYRQGVFKFVECKLGHEQLSERQKSCIFRLQERGFIVEVHKLVEDCTKTRKAIVNLQDGSKEIREKQMRLDRKWATA